ncbi:MAG: mechanosensitive ion channel family protein [Candidatus Dormibacteraeota bacterium]|nr:mechanosensitive ion channel family protein [Candidatus Dormibacteraeota bacterium]
MRRRRGLMRAAVAGALLVILLTVQADLLALAPRRYEAFVRIGLLAVAVGLGATAVREIINAIFRSMDRQAAVIWRNLSTWTLYALLALMIASALGVNLSGLLVGGAIVGVIVATASQASLGNFFAGLVLMFGRPYRVGGSIRVRGSIAGGVVFEGTVIDMGALYTTLRTAGGETLKLPNSGVVNSALEMGDAPLQAEVEVEIPPNTALGPVEEIVRARIGQPDAWIAIRPQTLRTLEQTTLVCKVQIRSQTPVEPMVLAEALIQAVGRNNNGDHKSPELAAAAAEETHL